VWRMIFTPVARLVAVTVAPGITAPVASVMTPWIEPVPPICASACNGTNKEKALSSSSQRNVLADFLYMTNLLLRRVAAQMNSLPRSQTDGNIPSLTLLYLDRVDVRRAMHIRAEDDPLLIRCKGDVRFQTVIVLGHVDQAFCFEKSRGN